MINTMRDNMRDAEFCIKPYYIMRWRILKGVVDIVCR